MVYRILLLMLPLLGMYEPVCAKEPLKVVATQAIFADLVKEIGGERVEVTHIAPPKYNVHFIQPRPSDVRKTKQADLYVNAGLDLEAWSGPLLEAAGNTELFQNAERNLDLSKGITILKPPAAHPTRAEGDVHVHGNPHYHMDPRNGLVMASAIAAKLSELDPEGASAYTENLRRFSDKLHSKLAEWKSMCAHCAGKEVISYHDDMEYLANYLGIEAHRFLEPKPGIPPTAKHLAEVEKDAIEHQVKVIVQPTYYSKEAGEYIASKINGKVVMVCQNAGELPGTESYFSFFDQNIQRLSEALKL